MCINQRVLRRRTVARGKWIWWKTFKKFSYNLLDKCVDLSVNDVDQSSNVHLSSNNKKFEKDSRKNWFQMLKMI